MENLNKNMNSSLINSDEIKNYFKWMQSVAPFRIGMPPEIVDTSNKELNLEENRETVIMSKPETVKPQNLEELEASLQNCHRCPLGEKRHHLVFGEGNPTADLMFIGEGPGYDEDMSGKPFIGKAGRLLTQIIENGLKIKRDSIYIANIVKCRPPGNRDPLENEANTCLPYLLEQINFIKPKVIVLLGKVATRFLLNKTGAISHLRNYEHSFGDSKVFITYHPSALLRNESFKRPVWEDMKKVIKELNL